MPDCQAQYIKKTKVFIQNYFSQSAIIVQKHQNRRNNFRLKLFKSVKTKIMEKDLCTLGISLESLLSGLQDIDQTAHVFLVHGENKKVPGMFWHCEH